jgi:hypothetical protein
MELTSLKYLQNRKELKFKLKTEYKIGNTKQKMNKRKERKRKWAHLTYLDSHRAQQQPVEQPPKAKPTRTNPAQYPFG